MDKDLFFDYNFYDFLENRKAEIRHYIDEIQDSQFAQCTDSEFFGNVFSTFELGNLLKLREDLKTIAVENTKIDIKKYRGKEYYFSSSDNSPLLVAARLFILEIPFEGEEKYLSYRPDRHKFDFPKCEILNKKLLLKYSLPESESKDSKSVKEKIDAAFNSRIDLIKFYINGLNDMSKAFDIQIKDLINALIANRRKNVENIENILSSLNIPIKPKDGTPNFTSLPVRKKIITPLPNRPDKPSEQSYVIDDGAYNDILGMIRHTGNSFQGTPSTYTRLEEEELRNVILSNLNCHFEGAATGETFSVSGKTDIFITQKGKSAFIAECKIWGGEKLFHEAINQLLGYLTWRECKTSIILFNKNNKDFSNIQTSIRNFIERHPTFKKWTSKQILKNEWRFISKGKDDDAMEIEIHVFLFNLYTSK